MKKQEVCDTTAANFKSVLTEVDKFMNIKNVLSVVDRFYKCVNIFM